MLRDLPRWCPLEAFLHSKKGSQASKGQLGAAGKQEITGNLCLKAGEVGGLGQGMKTICTDNKP